MIKYIHQVLPNFSRRDAIGTDSWLIRESLLEFGFESTIFHEISGEEDASQPLSQLQPFLNRADTAILFHFSVGSDFPGFFAKLKNKKIVRYHNITPPEFFCAPAEGLIRQVCARGRQQIPMLALLSDLVLADSHYNAQEFTRAAAIPAAVVPIFRDYSRLTELRSEPNIAQSLSAMQKPLILFVGRICPNKAQHDLLKTIALYKATFAEPIGLVLIGSFFSAAFRSEIEVYAAYLGLSIAPDLGSLAQHDVLITGSINDEQMASYYRHCSLFCCLSDHEGFGVPLVEAMNFGLPILAHKATAVGETVGSAAYTIDKSNWTESLVALRTLVTQAELRQECIDKGTQRAKHFALSRGQSILKQALVDHGILLQKK